MPYLIKILPGTSVPEACPNFLCLWEWLTVLLTVLLILDVNAEDSVITSIQTFTRVAVED